MKRSNRGRAVAARIALNATVMWRMLVIAGFALMVWLVPSTNAEQKARLDPSGGPDPFKANRDGDSLDQEVAKARKRRARRATPEARAERGRSRRAFRGMSADEAVKLAHSQLPQLIEAPAWDPFAGQKVKAFTGEYSAQLEGPGGKHQVVETTVPLQSKVGSGKKEPTDYTLERSAAGLEPKNPLLPTVIAGDVRDGVEVGDGLRIRLLGAAESTADSVEDKAFFANALTDSDLTVVPTPRGIQLGFQVRSEDAPESARFKVEGADDLEVKVVPMPDFKNDKDAKFDPDRPTPGSAEVRKDGKIIAVIRPPSAWDADGEEVESRYVLESDNTLRLDFLHHSADLKYPLLVDPAIERYRMTEGGVSTNGAPGFTIGQNFTEPGAWNYGATGAGKENYKNAPAASQAGTPWTSPLQIDTTPGQGFGPGTSFAQWSWAAPRSSWLYRADFSDMQMLRSSQNDNQYLECAQAGIAFANSWDWGPITQPSSNPPGYTTTGQDRWQKCGTFNPQAATHIPSAPHPGNIALFRMIFNSPPAGNPPQPTFGYTQDKWTALMGAAAVYVEDGQAPAYTSSTGLSGVDESWRSTASFQTTEDVKDAAAGETQAGNAGLGIYKLTLSVPGQVPGGSKTYTSTPVECTRKTACPWKHTQQVPLSTGDVDINTDGFQPMPEGTNSITSVAEDATGKTASKELGKIRLDRTPPELNFGGTLHHGGKVIDPSGETFSVAITDGSAATPAAQRSGVVKAKMEIRKDTDLAGRTINAPFTTLENYDQPCSQPEGSCAPPTWSRTFKRGTGAGEYSPGEYSLRVSAEDALGKTSSKTFTFFVPDNNPNRDADRLGLEDWWQYDSTETGAGSRAHVNLSNGNLVWHSTPIVNPGRGLSTAVNLTYNSQQRKALPLVETPVEQLLGGYNEAGQNFSLGISGITRLNERLNVDLALTGRVTLTDADGTQHVFTSEPGGSVFTAPAGVQLHLRKYSQDAGLVTTPAFGFQALQDPFKAWAATRPDGVTYFFDQMGYLRSIEDRTGNKISYTYEYRSPIKDVCEAMRPANTPSASGIFFLPGKVCPMKVTEVTDPGGKKLLIKYKPRTLADLGVVNAATPPGATPLPEFAAKQLVPDVLPYELRNATLETDGYASGPIASITDQKGRVTEFTYEGGYLKTLTEAKGAGEAKFELGYDANQAAGGIKPLTSIKDPKAMSGETAGETTVEYGASPNLATGLLTFDRQVQSIQDRSASQVAAPATKPKTTYAISQSANGSATALVTNDRNKTDQYVLDERGRMTSKVDPRSARTELKWDNTVAGSGTDDNNVSSITRAAGSDDSAETTMKYNQNGLLTDTTTDGQTTTLRYKDHAGTMLSQRLGASSGKSVDDGREFVSDLTSITKPGQGQEKFEYNDPNGNFLPDGLVRKHTDGAGNASSATYGANGLLQTSTDEMGYPTTYENYDASGEAQKVTDPRGKVWKYAYDAVANLTGVTDPRGTSQGVAGSPYTTSFTYDTFDRVLQATYPVDSSASTPMFRDVTRSYDRNGNLLTERKGATGTARRTYTPMDDVSVDTSPEGETTKQFFDAEENMVRRLAPMGSGGGAESVPYATEFTYNDRNERVAAVRRNSDTTAGTDAEGHPPAQLATGFAYDLRGNLTGVSDPKSNAANSQNTPEANAAAAIIMGSPTKRFAYTYDDRDNKLSQVENPGGAPLTTSWAYNGDDTVKSQTDPRGKTTTSTYDARGLLTDSTNPEGGRTHYGLRADGKLEFKVSPRGTEGKALDAAAGAYTTFRTDYTYDRNGGLATQSIPQAPNQYAGVSGKLTYTRDDVGNPKTIMDPNGASFTNTFYDTGELKSTDRPSWWNVSPGADAEGDGPQDPVEQLEKDMPSADKPAATDPDSDAEIKEIPIEGRAPQDGKPGGLPSTAGYGDYGEVKPASSPNLMPRAGTTSFKYDDEMRLEKVTDTTGIPRVLTRDNVGRIKQIDQPIEATSTGPGSAGNTYMSQVLDYDANGNLKQLTQKGAWRHAGPNNTTVDDDLVTNYTYDQFDRLIDEDAPGDSAAGREHTRYGYDANDNLTTKVTPRGSLAWKYTYDAYDRQTIAENPAGEKTGYGYDQAGNRDSETSPKGMPQLDTGTRAANYTTTKTFDGRNLVKTSTDHLGHVTNYDYDANGNQILVDAPGTGSREKTERTFDGRDLPWATTTGTGGQQRTVVAEYDGNHFLRRRVKPAGVNSTTKRPTYAWNGSFTGLYTQIDTTPAFNADVFARSASGLLTDEVLASGDPDGSGPAPNESKYFVRSYGYDTRGRVSTRSTPRRLTSACPAASATAGPSEYCSTQTTYTYYDSDWVKSTTEQTPSAGNRSATSGDDIVVNNSYDRRGNQTSWRSPKNASDRRTVTREFNPNGTLAKRSATDSRPGGPGQLSYTYGYNANHSMTSMGGGQFNRTTAIVRDDAERPIAIDETWPARPAGDPDQRTDAGRDTAIGYDQNGNVDNRRTDGTVTIPASGQPTYTGGKTTSFDYDEDDRETDMRVCMSGPSRCQETTPSRRRTVTTYFNSDAISTRTKPNGVIEAMTYNDDGRVASMRRDKPDGTSLKNQSYTYDPNGNRTQDERGTHVFNARDQLVKWTRGPDSKSPGSTVSYTLNGAGAIAQKVDTAGPGGQALTTKYNYLGANAERIDTVEASATGAQTSKAQYTYDGLGNLSRITPVLPTAGTASTFKYDEFGRLESTDGPKPEEKRDYRSDGLDRRDARIENAGQANQVMLDYSYVGLGEELSRQELTGGKTKTFDYDSSSRRLGQESKSSPTATPNYRAYASDANGSVEGLEDDDGDVRACPASATDCDQYRYDPYGDLENDESKLSTDAKDNPFRFEGFYYDSGIKTYDMQARSYRPDVGRFNSEDRYEASEGDFNLQSDLLTQNRYQFAGGNPVNDVEFDGHGTGGPSDRYNTMGDGTTYDRKTGKAISGQRKGTGGTGGGHTWSAPDYGGAGGGQPAYNRPGRTETPKAPLPGVPSLLDPKKYGAYFDSKSAQQQVVGEAAQQAGTFAFAREAGRAVQQQIGSGVRFSGLQKTSQLGALLFGRGRNGVRLGPPNDALRARTRSGIELRGSSRPGFSFPRAAKGGAAAGALLQLVADGLDHQHRSAGDRAGRAAIAGGTGVLSAAAGGAAAGLACGPGAPVCSTVTGTTAAFVVGVGLSVPAQKLSKKLGFDD